MPCTAADALKLRFQHTMNRVLTAGWHIWLVKQAETISRINCSQLHCGDDSLRHVVQLERAMCCAETMCSVLCTAGREVQHEGDVLVPCSVVHKLLELLQDLLHLWHCAGAVHQLPYFWVSQLV